MRGVDMARVEVVGHQPRVQIEGLEGGPPMSNRDVRVLALGRFLAMGRYCQESQPTRLACLG
jgi:hypothetical protein